MTTISAKKLTREEYLNVIEAVGNPYMLLQIIEHLHPMKDAICFELGCVKFMGRCPICFDGDKDFLEKLLE